MPVSVPTGHEFVDLKKIVEGMAVQVQGLQTEIDLLEGRVRMLEKGDSGQPPVPPPPPSGVSPLLTMDFDDYSALQEVADDPHVGGWWASRVLVSLGRDTQAAPWGGHGYFRTAPQRTGTDSFHGGLILRSDVIRQAKPREVWLEWWYRFNTWRIDQQHKFLFVLENHGALGGPAETNRWNYYASPAKFMAPGTRDEDAGSGCDLGSWWYPLGCRAGWGPNEEWFNNHLYDGRWHRLRTHLAMESTQGADDAVTDLWIDDLRVVDHGGGPHPSPDQAFFHVVRFGANGGVAALPASYDLGNVNIWDQDPGWS